MLLAMAALFCALVGVDKQINTKEEQELLFKGELTKDEFFKVMGWE